MACWVVYLAFRTLWQTSPDERWFEVVVGCTSGPGRVGCTVGRGGLVAHEQEQCVWLVTRMVSGCAPDSSVSRRVRSAGTTGSGAGLSGSTTGTGSWNSRSLRTVSAPRFVRSYSRSSLGYS